MELWVADLTNNGVLRLGTAALYLVAANPERNTIYYIRLGEREEQALVRVDLKTLEQTVLFTFGKCPPPAYAGLLAISPDERYCMLLRRLGERRYGIERIDLTRGEWAVIHEQDDIFNAHLQFSPAGKDLMVQQNRGGLVDANFNVIRVTGLEGATLYVIDEDGKNVRPMPVGKPHTTPVTGHETWIGKTGRVVLTTIGGKVYTAAPGEPEPTLVAEMPGLNHIAASADGRYFLVDDFRDGRLFMGSFATKRLLPFCDTGASCGSPQYTHTHPYITPDNRRVIFNSDRTGICQVYAADIPQSFLDALAAGDDLKK